MKQTFKILGIALFASIIMVACEKEPEGSNPSTPTNPPAEEDTTMSISVSLNGQEYTNFPYKIAKSTFLDGCECLLFEGHPADISDVSTVNSERMVCPGFRVVLNGQSTGTYNSYDINSDYVLTGNVIRYEFYERGALYKDGIFLGDWWGLNAEVKLTKFDVTAGLASFTASGDMFCSGEAILQGQGLSGCSRGTMVANIKNMPITK